jgi:hypothetical protein
MSKVQKPCLSEGLFGILTAGELAAIGNGDEHAIKFTEVMISDMH